MATHIISLARHKLQSHFHPCMSEMEKSQMTWSLAGEWMTRASIQLQHQQQQLRNQVQVQHSLSPIPRMNSNGKSRIDSRSSPVDLKHVPWRCVTCTLVNRPQFVTKLFATYNEPSVPKYS